MPEARDRLSRPRDDIAEIYIRRRASVARLGILPDEDESPISIDGTHFRLDATPLTGGGAQRPIGVAAATWTRRGGSAGRGLFGTPAAVYGRGGRSQNTPPSGTTVRRGRTRGGGSNSVLPSWYPRTPLRDITHVVRAVERRRAGLGDDEGQTFVSPIVTDRQVTLPDPSSSAAQQESDLSLVTSTPTLGVKRTKASSLGKIPKILADIMNQDAGEELLTPQKKLLLSIDMVEKAVKEELERLKKTPSAKKAERQRKVRTLMSMR